ncbi:hypothetical protein AVEN_247588-1 [Araneus ventricosus]|uniref:Uncharacterized protein n=1 Tax=Araneus ventricosus TaxID=182803 RepID=A0A4Y2DB91_ARAVE|nr:hypothetical protein AVEN_247588-1 [Araneus ventricosus]
MTPEQAIQSPNFLATLTGERLTFTVGLSMYHASTHGGLVMDRGLEPATFQLRSGEYTRSPPLSKLERCASCPTNGNVRISVTFVCHFLLFTSFPMGDKRYKDFYSFPIRNLLKVNRDLEISCRCASEVSQSRGTRFTVA